MPFWPIRPLMAQNQLRLALSPQTHLTLMQQRMQAALRLKSSTYCANNSSDETWRDFKPPLSTRLSYPP
jgi:hypothetical protein